MIIIPDTHGRDFWVKPVQESLGKEHIIFLGDYLDPYKHEGIPSWMALPRLEEIIALKRNHPDDVTLLLGNHDLHYINSDLGGSRYDYLKAVQYKKAFQLNTDIFQIVYKTERAGKKFLFSHAGVMWDWLTLLGLYPQDEFWKILNELWWDKTHRPDLAKALGIIPIRRGGSCFFGSPIWADVEDWDDDFYELEDFYQIFGHSQQEQDPVIRRHYACLDCRRAFRLTDDGRIEEYE